MSKFLKWFLGVVIIGFIIPLSSPYISKLICGREVEIAKRSRDFIWTYWYVISPASIVLLLIVFIVNRRAQQKRILDLLSPYFFLKPCGHLKPDDFNLLKDFYDAYIPRKAFPYKSPYIVETEQNAPEISLEQALREILLSRDNTKPRCALLIARPKMGKTRTVFQLLKDPRLARVKTLIVRAEPPSEFLARLKLPRQKHLIVFIDDLHKFSHNFDFQTFLGKISACDRNYCIIATARNGDEYKHLVREMPDYFLRLFSPLKISDLTTEEGKELADQIGKDYESIPFDGSPGSITLGIEEMIRRYRDSNLEEKCIMNSLALLYKIRHFSPERKDIELIADKIFGLTLPVYKFNECVKHLYSKGLLAHLPDSENKFFFSRDVYLDCIAKGEIPEGTINRVLPIAAEAKNTRILFSLGGYYYYTKDCELSLNALDFLLRIDAKNANVWYNKGVALVEHGKSDEAIKCYDRAVRINPDDAKAWVNKGGVLVKLGKLVEAIECFDRALSINPELAKAWYNKGVALVKLSKLDEAIECYDRAIKINPDDAGAWYNKGVVLGQQDNLDKAIKCYDRALKINPHNAEAWFSKGFVLGKQDKPDEEINCYDRALKINPDYADACYNKGVVLGKQRKLDEAIKCFNQSLRVNPDYARAWYNKGVVLGEQGNLDEARKCFERALAIDPQGEAGNAARDALANLV